MIGCCCGEGNSKIYRSFILRRNNLFYHFLRPGQGQAIRKRMVLPAKLLPAARKSKNISLSNLVIFSTIQILTSPIKVADDCIRSSAIEKIGEFRMKNGIRTLRNEQNLPLHEYAAARYTGWHTPIWQNCVNPQKCSLQRTLRLRITMMTAFL